MQKFESVSVDLHGILLHQSPRHYSGITCCSVVDNTDAHSSGAVLSQRPWGCSGHTNHSLSQGFDHTHQTSMCSFHPVSLRFMHFGSIHPFMLFCPHDSHSHTPSCPCGSHSECVSPQHHTTSLWLVCVYLSSAFGSVGVRAAEPLARLNTLNSFASLALSISSYCSITGLDEWVIRPVRAADFKIQQWTVLSVFSDCLWLLLLKVFFVPPVSHLHEHFIHKCNKVRTSCSQCCSMGWIQADNIVFKFVIDQRWCS